MNYRLVIILFLFNLALNSVKAADLGEKNKSATVDSVLTEDENRIFIPAKPVFLKKDLLKNSIFYNVQDIERLPVRGIDNILSIQPGILVQDGHPRQIFFGVRLNY